MTKLKRERQVTHFFLSDKRKSVGRNKFAPRMQPQTHLHPKRVCEHADEHNGNVTTQALQKVCKCSSQTRS